MKTPPAPALCPSLGSGDSGELLVPCLEDTATRLLAPDGQEAPCSRRDGGRQVKVPRNTWDYSTVCPEYFLFFSAKLQLQIEEEEIGEFLNMTFVYPFNNAFVCSGIPPLRPCGACPGLVRLRWSF